MNQFKVTIGTRTLTWNMGSCQVREAVKFLVNYYGEPAYGSDPRMGEVGSPRREITVEPQPVTVPEPERVPHPEPAKVPA